MALVVRSGKPTPVEVMTEVFRDLGKGDDVHWVLMKHGTFYTFPKSECKKGKEFDGNELLAKVKKMSSDAILSERDDGDHVAVLAYRDLWPHPTYIVLSCLRQAIGWVIVGETPHWAETEQQEAAVGYLARTRYEMDCEENRVVAASWPDFPLPL